MMGAGRGVNATPPAPQTPVPPISDLLPAMTSSPDVFTVTLPLGLPDAELVVRSALQAEQFSIITEIDFQAKFREKLGIDHPPHKTLGACNPQLASEALHLNADVALSLPCNVVLREAGGATIVTALRPAVALQPYGDLVRPIAERAEGALGRVFDHLSQSMEAP